MQKADLVRSNKAEKSGITQSWEKRNVWTVLSEPHTAEGQQQQGQRIPPSGSNNNKGAFNAKSTHTQRMDLEGTAQQQQRLCPSACSFIRTTAPATANCHWNSFFCTKQILNQHGLKKGKSWVWELDLKEAAVCAHGYIAFRKQSI